MMPANVRIVTAMSSTTEEGLKMTLRGAGMSKLGKKEK